MATRQFGQRATIATVSSVFAKASAPSTRSFSIATSLCAPRMNSNKEKTAKEKAKRKRKKYTMYKMPDMKEIKQFTLCDAIQYIKAFEVGRNPSVPKYDLAIRLKTKKDGPVLRNSIRLPHAVKTDIKICVICPKDSKDGKAAKAAGAALVGEDEVFDIIKNGKIDFDRCITTPTSLPKLQKEGLPRILGPRGLMPSVKLGTVTDDVGLTVANMMGGSNYRERQGVVRMAVGQLAFTPEMLRDNVKTFVGQLKKEALALSESSGFTKEVFEIVLSSTNSPGFSLSGEFRNADSLSTAELSVA